MCRLRSWAVRGGRVNTWAVVCICALLAGGCHRAEPPSSRETPAAAVDLAALRQSAEGGDANAQEALGSAYALGRGTAPDYKESAKWLTKAAEQNNAAAQHGLAELFEAGQGVEQSYEKALTWYRKAAEQGHSGAQYALAVLHAFGRGTRMNDTEAAKWYLKAAEQGEALAQFNIGQRYQAGRGVAKDPVEAFKWLSLAAKELPDSATTRDELKRQLSRQQVSEAKRRIDEFTVSKTAP